MRVKRDAISAHLRERVLKRDRYTCRYCYSTEGPFHLDHVYPFSNCGETTYNNLVTACARCNLKKHNRVGVWPLPIVPVERQARKPKKRNNDGWVYLLVFRICLLFGVTAITTRPMSLAMELFTTVATIVLTIPELLIAWRWTLSVLVPKNPERMTK